MITFFCLFVNCTQKKGAKCKTAPALPQAFVDQWREGFETLRTIGPATDGPTDSPASGPSTPSSRREKDFSLGARDLHSLFSFYVILKRSNSLPL